MSKDQTAVAQSWKGSIECAGRAGLTPCQEVKCLRRVMFLVTNMAVYAVIRIGIPMKAIAIWCLFNPAAFVLAYDVGCKVKMPHESIRMGHSRVMQGYHTI